MVQKLEKLKHTFLQEQKMVKLKKLKKNDKPKRIYAGNPNWAGDD
tara:strand:- start:1461 stop:1595 length:135 start_codon:yes stop_codon:yes gene_type:complete